MRSEEERLLASIKTNLITLRQIQVVADEMFGAEDLIYRFYHGSFKVYGIQAVTQRIVSALVALSERSNLNEQFSAIFRAGTGKVFTPAVNERWDAETRPMLEAYFHARYFLDMAIKYGEELVAAPATLPSGWAAVLYLFNMR